MEDFSHWYQADISKPYVLVVHNLARRASKAVAELDLRCLEPAEEAYLEAVNIYRSRISRDARKIGLVEQASCLEDIQRTVINAKSRYELTHQNKKVGKWLSRLSSRVNFYGNIMDVLVQHHPEYVALAWGGMKCLFVVSKHTQDSVKVKLNQLKKL